MNLLDSKVVIIAPHMDDEIIGCGGLMLMHYDKSRLHCIFASDGARSPSPLLPWQGQVPDDLAGIRAREADEVLSFIGVPEANRTRLGLPDGQLRRERRRLSALLAQRLDALAPDIVLVPFRFDLHSDHVAVHRAVRGLQRAGRLDATVLEYIVYCRWRLLRGRDVRSLLRADRLVTLDTRAVAEKKREALLRYESQTQRRYPWQESPILTPASVAQRCQEPETFLLSEAAEPLLGCFAAHKSRVLAAHYLERFGKRRKDQAVAAARWAAARLRRADVRA